MDPALGTAAVMDAGRAEPRPYGQRRYRVTGFVPGRPRGGRPGRGKAGKAAAVVTLPDPRNVHDGLVVVADEPAQLSLDPGQDALVCGLHDGTKSKRSHIPAQAGGSAARERPGKHLAAPGEPPMALTFQPRS